MKQGTPWSAEEEEALVNALYARREVLHVWLPTSADGSSNLGSALDEHGLSHHGEVYLKEIREEIEDGGSARTTGSLRHKLKIIFQNYFRGLHHLNAHRSADTHMLSVALLPAGAYRRRREAVAEKYPWWNTMHKMMLKYRREILYPSSGVGSTVGSKLPKGACSTTVKTERVKTQQANRASSGASTSKSTAPDLERKHPSHGTTAKSLKSQISRPNNDRTQGSRMTEKDELEKTKMELALAKKDIALAKKEIENLHLRNELRALGAHALQAADRDGKEGGAGLSRGCEKRQARTQSGHRLVKGKGKSIGPDADDSDIIVVSSDSENSEIQDRKREEEEEVDGEDDSDNDDDDDEYVEYAPRKKQRR